jgi:RNA polymerase sigma-70 factor (ECF subfamily)
MSDLDTEAENALVPEARGRHADADAASAPAPESHARRRKSSMPIPTDHDLVDRARSGDSRSFGELVRRHQVRIFRLAAHMLRDEAEAEDVTQEAFVRAFRALSRFDGRSEVYTWLYRITVNLSLNRIRSRKSSRIGADAHDPRLENLLMDPDPASDPLRTAHHRNLHITLCEGIDALSETLRTTLILVCVEGRSHEEASAVLGAPEGTIAWRVHEARRKLTEFLAARGHSAEEMGRE